MYRLKNVLIHFYLSSNIKLKYTKQERQFDGAITGQIEENLSKTIKIDSSGL
jgi:hypothetical protein